MNDEDGKLGVQTLGSSFLYFNEKISHVERRVEVSRDMYYKKMVQTYKFLLLIHVFFLNPRVPTTSYF